ncbi:unnamed protein product [marine sediment metagenome]|uniref:Uncharacterized protein n=1 Tax=marine sediment metagenome TaxID=412755 RepID=X0Z5F3_9ZZZZ
MLIKLTDPLSVSLGGWVWYLLIENGRVYASNKRRAKLEFVGRAV